MAARASSPETRNAPTAALHVRSFIEVEGIDVDISSMHPGSRLYTPGWFECGHFQRKAEPA